MPARNSTQRQRPRHVFETEMDYHDGSGAVKVKHRAKVVHARRAVNLILTVADIEESLALNGTGNSMLCAMSQSCKRQKNQFPHPFLGPIDWLYKTTFVATAKDGDGRITKCVKYEHRDDIAKLFDKPAGLRKLIARAQANDGKIAVRLMPPRNRAGESRQGGNVRNPTGARTRPTDLGRASNRRFAEVLAGRGVSLRPVIEAAA
jgi:hypothetical protein